MTLPPIQTHPIAEQAAPHAVSSVGAPCGRLTEPRNMDARIYFPRGDFSLTVNLSLQVVAKWPGLVCASRGARSIGEMTALPRS